MNKLAERYGLQHNQNTIKEIDLTKVENPFKGNFQEIYELVRDGKVKKLSNGGISVTMTNDIEEDNKLGYAFQRTYGCRVYELMKYLDLAEMLVTSGIIPQEITGEGRNLQVKVLNDKYLNIDGDEIEVEELEAAGEAEDEVRDCCDRDCDEEIELTDELEIEDADEFELTYNGNVRDYVRIKTGRCLARGCSPAVEYVNDVATKITNITYGRPLSATELREIRGRY